MTSRPSFGHIRRDRPYQAGRSKHWIKIKNRKHPAMSRVMEAFGYRTALVLFAVAVIIAMLVAFVTTLERADQRTATSETAPGTMGLAKARPPLNRAPGQPVFGK
jgi:hypothetical protein